MNHEFYLAFGMSSALGSTALVKSSRKDERINRLEGELRVARSEMTTEKRERQ